MQTIVIYTQNATAKRIAPPCSQIQRMQRRLHVYPNNVDHTDELSNTQHPITTAKHRKQKHSNGKQLHVSIYLYKYIYIYIYIYIYKYKFEIYTYTPYNSGYYSQFNHAAERMNELEYN